MPKKDIPRITDANKNMRKSLDSITNQLDNSLLFSEDNWLDQIAPTVIHFAHRKKGWEPSDPIIVRKWVNHSCDTLSSNIRPICRYLKAWRDQRWPDGDGPSSIFLLALTINSFSKKAMNQTEMLEVAIKALTSVLHQPLRIPKPTPEDPHNQEDLRAPNRISDEKRQEYQNAFNMLANDFQQVRITTSKEKANLLLVQIFGQRFPIDIERIHQIDDHHQITQNEIRSTPSVAAPLVTTHRSETG